MVCKLYYCCWHQQLQSEISCWLGLFCLRKQILARFHEWWLQFPILSVSLNISVSMLSGVNQLKYSFECTVNGFYTCFPVSIKVWNDRSVMTEHLLVAFMHDFLSQVVTSSTTLHHYSKQYWRSTTLSEKTRELKMNTPHLAVIKLSTRTLEINIFVLCTYSMGLS